MLAQAFLAGDRAAFLGRDDLLAHLVELRVIGLELREQLLVVGAGLDALGQLLAQVRDLREQLAFLAEQVGDLQRGLVLRHAVGAAVLDATVERDGQRQVIGLAVLEHAHRVLARRNAHALRAGTGDLRRRRHLRRLGVHGPGHAVEAATRRGRQLVDELAARIEHLDLQLAEQMARALVVGDHGPARRIVADEHGRAVGPAAVDLKPLLRRLARREAGFAGEQRRRHRAQRRDVVDDPDAAAMRADDQIVRARLDRQIAHGHVRQAAALEARPVAAAVDRYPEAELGAEEQQVGLDQVFLDHVRIAAHALAVVGAEQARPGLAVVGRAIEPRLHVAKRVAVEGRIGGAGGMAARLDPAHPAVRRQARHVGDDVGPVLAAVARELQVAVVGADPDRVRVLRRLADRVDRRVHLGRRVVDGDAAAQLLLLLGRIVGREVRREALPGLALIARAEQELAADVERLLVGRAQRDRRVPVPAKLLVQAGLGLDVAELVRVDVDAADVAALVFGIDVVRIGRIGVDPEAVAAVEVFPARIRDAAGIARIAAPGAVVLQAAEHVVRIRVVDAHVIELRDRQVVALPPLVAAVVGQPEAAIVAGDHVLDIVRIDPDAVHVAMHAVEAADRREALAAVIAADQRAIGLVDELRVDRIDDQMREVERTPDHPLALVALLPGAAAVVGNVERAVDAFDDRIDGLRIARRDGHGDAAIRLFRQAGIRLRRQLGPGLAAIGGAEQA